MIGRRSLGAPGQVRLPSVDTYEARLPRDEIRVVRGIRVTSVPRTILDLAATASEQEVARLVNEAEVKRLWDDLSLWDLLLRYPRRAGTKAVRFLAFLERHGLPRPGVNVWLTVGRHMYEVDCQWRRQRLVVELDGRGAHDTAKAFESDRAKDRRLRVAGWQPIRVTWRQLHREERELAADLAALLS